MSIWPCEIGDEEAIARGICSPYHVKRGKLKPDAYWPPYDSDEISVMRASWIGADACKRHAKDLENPGEGKIYKGLAILSAQQIRQSGARLVDTRTVFLGHADICHDIVPKRGEPLPAEQLKTLRERAKALATLANYYLDSDPAAEVWTGPDLHYKAS
jgi:hypothetical protein